MECYTISAIAHNQNPLLRSVDCAIILTMQESTRKLDPNITKIAHITYIQRNKGFRKCFKQGVKYISQDIIHAYQHAARFLLDQGVKRALILEDDACLHTEKLAHFFNVDTFCSTNQFDVYSLGSMCIMIPIDVHHRRILGKLYFAHAIIWSQYALERLNGFDFTKSEIGSQIDTTVISSFDRKYSYEIPLVTQLFPETESSKQWVHPNKIIEFAANHRSLLQLDTKHEPGWSVMYFVCGPLWWMILAMIVVCWSEVRQHTIRKTRTQVDQ